MKRIGIVSVIVLLTILGVKYIYNPPTPRVEIHGHSFVLEIAATPQQKEKGLGYRDSLPQDHAMIFSYTHKDYYGFWMKGMRFPLDFLWIDGNTIVELSKNVPAPSSTQPLVELHPTHAVDKIIELNAGTIDKTGISVGDTVVFKTN